MATKRKASQPTGLYWPCPFNPLKHPQPLGIPVMRGANRFFMRCQCGGNTFMPPDWTEQTGLTAETAGRMGLIVLTLIRKGI